MRALDTTTGLGAVSRRHWRPATRQECPLERPCPYVGCRHHLLLNARPDGTLELHGRKNGTGRRAKLRAPSVEHEFWEAQWIKAALERLWQLEETCSLDVAARGKHTQREVAQHVGRSLRGVISLEVAALDSVRERRDDR